MVPMGGWISIVEIGGSGVPRIADPPAEIPPILVGSGAIAVATRLPDFGDVELEVWAGDPGAAPPDWLSLLDGNVETRRRGFEVGTATAWPLHLNLPPGKYHIRIEVHRDAANWVDAVRISFPDLEYLESEVRP